MSRGNCQGGVKWTSTNKTSLSCRRVTLTTGRLLKKCNYRSPLADLQYVHRIKDIQHPKAVYLSTIGCWCWDTVQRHWDESATEACQAHYKSLSRSLWAARSLRPLLAGEKRPSPRPLMLERRSSGPSGCLRCEPASIICGLTHSLCSFDVNIFYPSGVQTEH